MADINKKIIKFNSKIRRNNNNNIEKENSFQTFSKIKRTESFPNLPNDI